MELWDGRWGFPVPLPPVSKLPIFDNDPSLSRRYATTSFFCASFVWT